MAIKRETHKLDATDQSPGRLASEISIKLQGKAKPDYQPHIDGGDFIIVSNTKKMKITGNKMEGKLYYRHSGYPGGLKTTQLKKLFSEKPNEVLRKAVYNMLPKNRLRNERMKRLTFAKIK